MKHTGQMKIITRRVYNKQREKFGHFSQQMLPSQNLRYLRFTNFSSFFFFYFGV